MKIGPSAGPVADEDVDDLVVDEEEPLPAPAPEPPD